jgi:hypothetical protein
LQGVSGSSVGVSTGGLLEDVGAPHEAYEMSVSDASVNSGDDLHTYFDHLEPALLEASSRPDADGATGDNDGLWSSDS